MLLKLKQFLFCYSCLYIILILWQILANKNWNFTLLIIVLRAVPYELVKRPIDKEIINCNSFCFCFCQPTSYSELSASPQCSNQHLRRPHRHRLRLAGESLWFLNWTAELGRIYSLVTPHQKIDTSKLWVSSWLLRHPCCCKWLAQVGFDLHWHFWRWMPEFYRVCQWKPRSGT